MNEEAIDIMYKVAIDEGYRKSKSDFLKLMGEDFDALRIMFENAKDKGYTKTMDEFAKLMGVETLPEKKNPDLSVTDSPSEDGSSEFKPISKSEFVDKLEDLRDKPGRPTHTFEDVKNQAEDQITPDAMPMDATQRGADAINLPMKRFEDFQEQQEKQEKKIEESILWNTPEERKKRETAQKLEDAKNKRLEAEKLQNQNAYNDLINNNIEFQEDIVTIDPELTNQKEEAVVKYLTEKFSKYGFVFSAIGWGNKIQVSTLDGLNYIEIGVNDNDPALSKKLQDFIIKHSTPPEARTEMPTDFITQSIQAQQTRDIGRHNGDGSVSTHKMVYAEEDGRFVVFPTLFPTNPDIQSAWPERWTEFGSDEWEDALEFAKTRGEVYYFDTEEEAEKFTNGAWKNVASPEIFAQQFYQENGKDYYAEQEMFEQYEYVKESIYFIEKFMPEYGKNTLNIPTDLAIRFPEYVKRGPDGKNSLYPDWEEKLEELEEQEDILRTLVMSDEAEDLRDELDLKLHRNFEYKANEAAELNQQALEYVDQMNVMSLKYFGVPLDDLEYVVPQTEKEKNLKQELIASRDVGVLTSQFAAYKYENSKTFYDRKNDKNITHEYLEGMKGWTIALKNAWNRGQAGKLIIQMELGMKDPNDKELQARVAEYLSNVDPRQSKLMYRFQRAEGWGESKKYLLGESGARLDLLLINGLGLMSESLTQMLPYGMVIIPTTTAVGAATGAGTALVAGQLGPQAGTPEEVVSVPAAATTGALWGFRTGFALSGFVLEYTNSIMESMGEAGYDLTNPDDVAKAFADKEVWKEGREMGLKRGIPIALVDFFSAGLAGRVFKVGKTASMPTKVLAMTGERIIFDPGAEGFGEYLAQVTSGQEINSKEILLESWGGLGNNTSHMAVNMFMDKVNNSKTDIANNLLDFDYMANENVSDSRISTWSTNMNNLNKISDEQNQQIQENVGNRRTAKELLGKNASTKTIARAMELLSAKKDLSRTPNLKQVNSKTISDIDAELSEMVRTGQIVENGINVDALIDVKAPGMKKSSYTIDGKKYSKKSFMRRIARLTSVEVEELDINVINDDKVLTLLNDKINALQESKTKSLDVEKQTTDGATMGTRDTQQETTTKSQTTPVQEETIGVETEIPSIPTPIKATRNDKIKYTNNDLDQQRLDGLLAEVASKNMNNRKLTPFQQQLFKDNTERIAEIESDMQGALDLETILNEGTKSKVDFKTEGKIDNDIDFVNFKSASKNQQNKIKRAPVEGGMTNAFVNLVNNIVDGGGRGARGMMFTESISTVNVDTRDQGKGMFEIDEQLITRIKNGDVEVSYAVIDGKNLTPEQRSFFQVPANKARVFLHADGQLLGRLEMIAGREGTQMGKENGTVTISEIHPALQGLGLGQQLYESANDYVQETYNQPLKSDKNYTSKKAERAWSALEEKGKASRRKPTVAKKESNISRGRKVMGETQFSFRDEKMLVDALNQAFATYGALTPSEISRIISGLVTEGDPINNNTQLLAFMNKSFPSVNISSTQEAFNNVISRDDVRQYTKDGQVYYGVTVDGDIWINPEVHNTQSQLFDTSIHEFGHVWTNYLQTTEKGQQIYRKGAELVQQTALYKRQLKKFNGDATKAVNETMAIMIANKGVDIADASLLSKFKNWLQGMWTYIKTQFKMSKDLTTSEIENMTLDKFLGTALADIFSGKEIKLTDKQLIQLKNPEVMFSSTDSIVDIVNKGRQQGISDASIKSVLQSRGFKATDINEAMRIQMDENVTLPTEFTNIEGGAIAGLRLFSKIKKKLNDYAYSTPEGKKRARRVKTYSDVRAEAQRLLKESELFQKQNVDTQMAMQVALDRSLEIRTNPTIQKEISGIRNIIKNKKLAVKDIKNLQNQLRGLIRKTLPKSSSYSQTQINSLLKRITDLTAENYIAKTEEVVKIIDKQKTKIKNELIQKIEKLVRKKSAATVTKGGRKVTKGLDAMGREFFKEVKKVLKVALIQNDDTRNAEIQKLKEDISAENILKQLQITEAELITKALNNPEALTDNEQSMLNKLKAFDTVGDVMTASMEEVQAKLKILEEARAESIGRLQLKRLERAAKQEKLSEQATKQIEETYPELFTTDKEGNKIPKNKNQLRQDKLSIKAMFKKGKLLKGLKSYVKTLKFDSIIGIRSFFKEHLSHLGTLTQLLDRGLQNKNFFNNNIYKPLRRMHRNQMLGIEKVNKKFNEIANSIPGVTKGYKQIRKQLYIGIVDLKIKGEIERYSGDQLLRIYSLSKNETQRAKLEKQGFTPEKIDEIKKILGAQPIEFADKVVEYLSNEYFPTINEVYKESNDVNLDYVENYFPTQTISRKKATEKLLIEGNFGSIFSDETHSALKERADVTGDVNLDPGFLDTLTNHIESMEHYKAYALGVKNLTAIVNTPSVKVLLETSGLDRAVKRAINFAVNPDSLNDSQQGFIEKIMTKFTSYALAFRLMQIPKQASSFINAFEDYKFMRSRAPKDQQSRLTKIKDVAVTPVELLAFMADVGYVMLTLPKQLQKAYKLSPVFRDRVKKGLEGDLYGLVSGSPTDRTVSQKETRMGDFLRAFKFAMSSPTVLGDVMGVMGYMANYNADLRAGVDPDVALENFETYELTQQTRGRTEKIPLQMSTDFKNRFFTMFGSTLFLQMNKVYMGMTNIMRAASKGTVDSDAIRAFVLNLGVANVLFLAMANMFKYFKGEDEDKEDVLKQMKRSMYGMNLIDQVPFIGGSLEYAILKMAGENPRQIEEGVNPLNRITTEMIKYLGDEDLSFLQKGVKTVESVAELYVGFQFDPFFKLTVDGDGVGIDAPIKTLIEQGDVSEEAFYDVIGVSPSYRPASSRKKKKSKKKKTTRKRSPGHQRRIDNRKK